MVFWLKFCQLLVVAISVIDQFGLVLITKTICCTQHWFICSSVCCRGVGVRKDDLSAAVTSSGE